jgi:Protein of unknown function (DUF3108)
VGLGFVRPEAFEFECITIAHCMVALTSPLMPSPEPRKAATIARALTLTLPRALGILAAVLVVHIVVLWWARDELQTSGFTAPNKVMYSRLIVPALPEAVPVAADAPAAPAPAMPVKSVRKATPKPPSSPRVISQAAPAEVPAKDLAPPVAQASEPQAQAEPPAAVASASVTSSNADTPIRNIIDANDNIRADNVTNKSIGNEAQAYWPSSSKVSYNLSGYYRGDLHGSGAFEWLRESDNRYQLFLRVKSLVGIEYRSRGKLEGAALKPERYEEQLPRGVTSVSFNYDTSKVSFSRITDVIDMTPGIQDRASAIMSLVSVLARDARRIDDAQRSGELIKVPVASPTGTDVWDFKVIALETVNADSGPVQAWHLQRLPRKANGDLGVDLWLSQALRGLPVRIKLTLSSDTYLDLTMTKAEQE